MNFSRLQVRYWSGSVYVSGTDRKNAFIDENFNDPLMVDPSQWMIAVERFELNLNSIPFYTPDLTGVSEYLVLQVTDTGNTVVNLPEAFSLPGLISALNGVFVNLSRHLVLPTPQNNDFGTIYKWTLAPDGRVFETANSAFTISYANAPRLAAVLGMTGRDTYYVYPGTTNTNADALFPLTLNSLVTGIYTNLIVMTDPPQAGLCGWGDLRSVDSDKLITYLDPENPNPGIPIFHVKFRWSDTPRWDCGDALSRIIITTSLPVISDRVGGKDRDNILTDYVVPKNLAVNGNSLSMGYGRQAADPDWGWTQRQKLVFVNGGTRRYLNLIGSTPIHHIQIAAKYVTPDGTEYPITLTEGMGFSIKIGLYGRT